VMVHEPTGSESAWHAALRTCPCVKTDRCGLCGINACIPHNVVSVASCAITCCAPAYKEPPSTVIRCLQPCDSSRITFDFSLPSLELNRMTASFWREFQTELSARASLFRLSWLNV